MATTPFAHQFSWPVVDNISFGHFSLYKRNPNLSLDLNRGVFCLVGANGLGKSTFLNALNFALTGFVPDHEAGFFAIRDYGEKIRSRKLWKSYFDGRISEADRKQASIAVRVRWGNASVEIQRPFFTDTPQLTSLRIEESPTERAAFDTTAGTETDRAALQARYESEIVDRTGLGSFSQFVFFMHFLFTFDEARHLTLFDNRAVTSILQVAIGGGHEEIERHENLMREVDQFDSQARNSKYQARMINNHIDLLNEALANHADLPDTTLDNYEDLKKNLDFEEKSARGLEKSAEESQLRIVDLSSDRSQLEIQFRSAFNSRVHQKTAADFHPLVRSSISDNRCGICGSGNVDHIVAALNEKQCPLCHADIERHSAEPEALERLRSIDAKLGSISKRLEDEIGRRQRLVEELELALQRVESLRSKVQEMEAAHGIKPTDDAQSTAALTEKLQGLITQQMQFNEAAELFRKKRDNARKQLEPLHQKLKENYAKIESEFLPIFQGLASGFLGLELSISLDISKTLADFGASFRLQVEGSYRADQTRLSESQRFFLDIAFRMAIVSYLSEPGTGLMLLDTPEGSLDVAYESTAGRMLAEYGRHHNLLMTVNVNSSQLMLQLFRDMSPERCHMERMMAWCELSKVQREQESRFAEALANLEKALQQG